MIDRLIGVEMYYNYVVYLVLLYLYSNSGN